MSVTLDIADFESVQENVLMYRGVCTAVYATARRVTKAVHWLDGGAGGGE
jgi:hypothetical protein